MVYQIQPTGFTSLVMRRVESETRFCVFFMSSGGRFCSLNVLIQSGKRESADVANCRRLKPRLCSVVAFRKLACLPNERLVLLP